MTTLTEELSKPQYTGLTDEQALAALQAVTVGAENLIPATTVNQLFAKLDLTGFIQDIAATHDHQFRHKMASVILSIGGDHPFNFIEGTTAGDGNLAMLDSMIANLPELAAKLQQFRTVMHDLANKKRSFAAVTLAEVMAARAAELDSEWSLLTPNTTRLMVSLHSETPELAAIRIEQRVSHDGVHWTNWDRLTPIIVQAAGFYYHNIPASDMQREIRWRGEEHRINGTIEAI